MEPIWKDHITTLPGGNYCDYTVVTADGENIYSGRAYLRPGADAIEIRLNDICRDYLGATFPAPGNTAGTIQYIRRTFRVYAGQTLVESVDFCNDWTYDYNAAPSDTTAARPVNGVLAPLQPLTWTTYAAGTSVTALITMRNGTTQSVSVPVTTAGSFDASYSSNDYDTARAMSGAGTCVLALESYPNAASVAIGGITYKVADCGRWVLYYLNARGGWDSLLMEGAVSATASMARDTARRDVPNTQPLDRKTRVWRNGITRKWEMHTGWLTEEQSSRMWHLLGTTQAVLLDVTEGRWYPVTITETDAPYKTRRTESGSLISYTVNAEYAMEAQRR